jgi:hypothetical protein
MSTTRPLSDEKGNNFLIFHPRTGSIHPNYREISAIFNIDITTLESVIKLLKVIWSVLK